MKQPQQPPGPREGPEEPLEAPRQRTRRLDHPWPFPESIVEGELVKNRYEPPGERRSSE